MMTTDEMRSTAEALAPEFDKASVIASGTVAAQSAVPSEIRSRFIAFRTELIQRGLVDPVLARFDSGTVSQASPRDIAEQLRKIATSV